MDKMLLRDEAFYKGSDVELRLGTVRLRTGSLPPCADAHTRGRPVLRRCAGSTRPSIP
jgi:hypothetical protein